MSEIEDSGPTIPGGSGLGWMPIAVAFIVISAALGGVLAFNVIMESGGSEGEVTATVKVNYGNGTVETSGITTENSTVLGILEDMVEYGNIDMTHYEGLGWLVNGINGISNGVAVTGINDTGNYYWQYYVNDDLGPISADRFALQDGDVVEWRYEEMVW